MKQDQSHNIRYFGIEKCSGVSNSNRIVISIEQKKHIGDWKDLQEAEQISNIMYSDTHVLFRAKNTLGFTCNKPFDRCGGHQQDFPPEKRNLMLKELGECMQCSSKCESEICAGEKNNETEEAVQSQMGLITGCSFAFIIFILVIVIVVVLMKRKKVANANQRRSKDENPIYGPRETVYVDEVLYGSTDCLYFSSVSGDRQKQ